MYPLWLQQATDLASTRMHRFCEGHDFGWRVSECGAAVLIPKYAFSCFASCVSSVSRLFYCVRTLAREVIEGFPGALTVFAFAAWGRKWQWSICEASSRLGLAGPDQQLFQRIAPAAAAGAGWLTGWLPADWLAGWPASWLAGLDDPWVWLQPAGNCGLRWSGLTLQLD